MSAARVVLVVLVVAVMISAFGVGLVGGAHPAASSMSAAAPKQSTSSTPLASSSTTAAGAPSTASASVTSNAGINAASRALAASEAAGISPNFVFVPRPSASPSQIAASESQGYVTPLYSATPAPMGLAEFGLRQNTTTGNVSPFILNTTSVQATFDPSANGGPNATDLADSSPDGYGVQLNAVVTNITLFGNDSYQFWTQNVVEYFPYSGAIYLITNVWNFTGPELSTNVFYAHGPLGTQVGTEYYYAFAGPFAITYPFDMTFTMTSNITDGRNAVYFSLTATSPDSSMDINMPNYDYVIFNSLAATTPPLTQPANYTADGYHYNPFGLTNDFELTIGGPGGGSQTTFLTANAHETLSYWDATAASYEAVPSAYSYGGETGETSVGVGMSWMTGPNGQPIGVMSTGPSLMGGLWNASSPKGGPATINLHVQPGNAFVWVSYNGSSSSPFNITEPEWAPTVYSSVLVVPQGEYAITFALADYTPWTYNGLASSGPSLSLWVNLTWDASLGVYTPLWAWSNTQIGNISTSGAGTLASPYIVVNSQTDPLAGIYGVLNDYGFPVFPGVYLIGTTAYTEFASPPSLSVYTTGVGIPNDLPTMNNLPYWFYDTSNIAIVDATDITGWFSVYAYDYPYFLTDNVEFWNSTNMLIANDTFNTEAHALLLYNGYSASNPFAAGDATIWGNMFVQAATPTPSADVVPASWGLGLSEQENFDLIYNNYFSTPTTAVSFPIDLYYGYLTFYVDTWNITPVASSVVNYDSNWPAFALTGSIIGGATQGGNYWWDYGLSFDGYYLVQASFYPFYNSNPYNVIPYVESGWIDPFGFGIGDYAPLLFSPLLSVTLVNTNLPSGVVWSYTISDPTGSVVYWTGDTSSSSVALTLTQGAYQLDVSALGYADIQQEIQVTGATTINLAFTPLPVSVVASPSTDITVTTIVTFTVTASCLVTACSGTAMLYIGSASGTVRIAMAVAIVDGQGVVLAIPGLALHPGESTLSYWITFAGQTSTPATLTFATVAPPTTLTLSVSTNAGGYSTFSITSDSSDVSVTLWAHSASGTLLAVFTVGLGIAGSGSVVLYSALLPSGTVWVATYGSVTSNTVTT